MTRFMLELNGRLGEFWMQKAVESIKKAEADIESGKMVIDADGIARWASNNQCIMDDMAEIVEHTIYADRFDREYTKVTRELEMNRFIIEYMRRPKRICDEYLYEMRCNYGPGAEVVDVATGEVITV